jgi:RNA polymerase-binding transcription factor DksA
MSAAAEHRSPPAASVLPGKPTGPHWRALLEARWRARLQEVTELSLAYASTPDGARTPDGVGTPDGVDAGQDARSLLHRAVAARRKLADVEEALGRLAAGTFGRCEQCGSAIGPHLLSVVPEARYCPRCAAGTRPAAWC